MSETGFVRLSRKFFDMDLWKEQREMSRAEAWLDMIASAAFASESRMVEGRCLNLQRGELWASQRYLARRWSWGRSKVERFLENLTAAGRIRARNEPGFTVITLCNYDIYNPARATSEPATGPPTRPTTSQGRAKVEEGKELKEEKNIAGLCPAETESQGAARFKAPSIDEVRLLCAKCGLPASEAEVIWNFYESKGWMVGKTKMKSLAGCVGGWAARKRSNGQSAPAGAASWEAKRQAEGAEKAKAARMREIERLGKTT
jgi:hypothetical protein